jgi:Ser/Thr protein kinase RdoA (MazF antagonist)
MVFLFCESAQHQSRLHYSAPDFMANLNSHDILFIFSRDFQGLRRTLETAYGFLIFKSDVAPFLSFTSKKAIIRTNKGIFFLKEKPKYCSSDAERILAAEFQSFLSKKLGFVPDIIKTLSGEYYVKWNNRFYFLTDYKEGRVFNGSNSDIKKVLAALRLFQSASLLFRSRTNFQKVESCSVLKIAFLARLFVHKKGDKIIWRLVQQVIKKLMYDYKKYKVENFLMSHGDFSLFNIVFNKNKITAINDFDNVTFLPRIHDLAEFFVSSTMINYMGPTTNLQTPIFLKPNEEKTKIILSYYSHVFKLTENEINLFPILVKIIWFELLLLAVVKEDYKLSDLKAVLKVLNKDDFLIKLKCL